MFRNMFLSPYCGVVYRDGVLWRLVRRAVPHFRRGRGVGSPLRQALAGQGGGSPRKTRWNVFVIPERLILIFPDNLGVARREVPRDVGGCKVVPLARESCDGATQHRTLIIGDTSCAASPNSSMPKTETGHDTSIDRQKLKIETTFRQDLTS